ncbi:MAG: phosphodiester glycosidase family protein, partial [Planctomycetota bacterium]
PELMLAAAVGALAGGVAGLLASEGEAADPAWTPLFPGVAWTEVATAEPRVLRIVAVRVDLEEPGIDFLVTPPNGERPLETDGLRTTSFLRKHGCQVAVNASPFQPIVSEEGEPQDVLGLSISRGERYSEPKPSSGALLIFREKRARIAAPPVEPGDAHNAVGGFGIIVRDGENVGSDDALHPRTAAGVSRDGRYLILLAIDGRQPGYSLGATTRETADWLLRLGAFQGLNLDGGGSTAIAAEGRDGAPVLLNRPVHGGVPGRERVSANHLGVFAPRPPAGVPVAIARDAPPAPLGSEEAADLTADFRYSPPWWQVTICLPDDWQKTLVSREGDLLYDYRGAEGFGTRVSISVAGAGGAARTQELASPRVPIVETRIERGGERLAAWKCLAVVPGGDLPAVDAERQRVIVEQTTRPTPLPGWGKPAVPAIDAFRNIVAGFDGPIGYRFRAAPGARYALAFGFLESHHAEPGKRIVEVFAEGRKAARLDLIADAGRHRPRVVFADAADEDGDGYVRFEVRPAPESEDQYPILNALWVFPAKLAPSAEELIAGRYRTRALAEVD